MKMLSFFDILHVVVFFPAVPGETYAEKIVNLTMAITDYDNQLLELNKQIREMEAQITRTEEGQAKLAQVKQSLVKKVDMLKRRISNVSSLKGPLLAKQKRFSVIAREKGMHALVSPATGAQSTSSPAMLSSSNPCTTTDPTCSVTKPATDVSNSPSVESVKQNLFGDDDPFEDIDEGVLTMVDEVEQAAKLEQGEHSIKE